MGDFEHIQDMEYISDSDFTELSSDDVDDLYFDLLYDEWLKLRESGNQISFRNFCNNREYRNPVGLDL